MLGTKCKYAVEDGKQWSFQKDMGKYRFPRHLTTRFFGQSWGLE